MKRKICSLVLGLALSLTSVSPVRAEETVIFDASGENEFVDVAEEDPEEAEEETGEEAGGTPVDVTAEEPCLEIPEIQEAEDAAAPDDLDSGRIVLDEFSEETEVFSSDIFSAQTAPVFSDGEAAVADDLGFKYDYDAGTKTLTVSGAGRMNDYSMSLRPGWDEYRQEAENLIIQGDITYLGCASFYNFTVLKSVTLPASLMEIGEAAFANCGSLAELALPEGLVKINDYAFQKCPIKTLAIPASVRELTARFLFRCDELENISASPDNGTFASSEGVLFNKDMTTLCVYPSGKAADSYLIPSSVTAVGAYAFYMAAVKEVQIPESVTTLGEGCFYKSSITTLTIPDSVVSLGNAVCAECPALVTVHLGNGLKALPDQAFQRCSGLKSVSFGKQITDLGAYTFSFCTSLETIVIPEGVTTVSNGCFGECSALQNITFPSTLKEIRYQAFMNCPKLTAAAFPEGLESIGNYAFYNSGLQQVTLPVGIRNVGGKAFPASASVTSPDGAFQDSGEGAYIKVSILPVKVTYDYESAWQVFDRMNKERAAQGLSAAAMDQELLEAAMVRAAEISVAFSHTRPTGLNALTVCTTAKAENIAAGQGDAGAVMENWMNSEEHKGNILNSGYEGVGVGAVIVNGISYWVQLFGEKAEAPVEQAQYHSRSAVADVFFRASEGSGLFSVNTGAAQTLHIGGTGTADFYIHNGFSNIQIAPEYLDFVSSDPAVCKVSSEGEIQAAGQGNANITISLKNAKDLQAVLQVTVKKYLDTPKIKSAVSTGPRSVKITWEAVPGASSYTLYCKAGKARTWYTVKKNITRTSYTHRSLKMGTTYTYTVRAAGSGAKSLYDKKGKSCRPVPTAAKLKRAVSTSYNTMQITWDKVSGAAGYDVYIKKNGRYRFLGRTEAGKTSFVHKSSRKYPIIPGNSYTYTVRAYGKVEEKKVSGSYSKTGITAKAALGRTQWNKVEKTEEGIRLSWKKSEGAYGYFIYRYEDGRWISIGRTRSLSYTDEYVHSGKTYKYRVRAYRRYNKAVYGKFSSIKGIKF